MAGQLLISLVFSFNALFSCGTIKLWFCWTAGCCDTTGWLEQWSWFTLFISTSQVVWQQLVWRRACSEPKDADDEHSICVFVFSSLSRSAGSTTGHFKGDMFLEDLRMNQRSSVHEHRVKWPTRVIYAHWCCSCVVSVNKRVVVRANVFKCFK